MRERIIKDIAKELEQRHKNKSDQQKLMAQADRLKMLLGQRNKKRGI